MPTHPNPAVPQLPTQARTVLDIETMHPGHSAAKEAAIRSRLNVSPVRYYQLLHRLSRTAAALAADPILVRRVRRLQDARSDRFA